MNFWQLGGAAPSDGESKEVIIRSFEYWPLGANED
jgi:hypothetical protein